MKLETTFSSTAVRWIDASLHALDPVQEVSMEAELLKHLPFARAAETADLPKVLRMSTLARDARRTLLPH